MQTRIRCASRSPQRTMFAVWVAAICGTASIACADTLIVSNRGDGTVRFFDTQARDQVAEVRVELGAHEFAVSHDGRVLVGACYGSGPGHKTPDNRLFVMDVDQLGAPRIIDLGDNPRPNDMRFLPGGNLVVTSEVQRRVLEVDVRKGTIVRELPFHEPAGHMLATSPDGMRIYVPCVASGKVVVLDAASGEILASVATAHGAEGVDVSPDGTRVWVACNRSSSIAVIDAETLKVVKTIQADGFPFRVRCTPDGKSVVVSHPQANELRVYDTTTGDERGRVALPGGQPTSLALSVDGTRAFVVCGALSKIAEINLATMAVVHWYETGPMPDAIAVSAVKAAIQPD